MSTPLWLRRLLFAPLLLVLAAIVIGLSPLLFVLAALLSGFSTRWRPLRVLCIVVVYLARDAAATLGCLGLWLASGFGRKINSPPMQRAHYRLVRWFLDGLYATAVGALNLRVEVERSEAAEAALRNRGRPILVFSRHAGTGDSFLLVHALLSRYGRQPRVVMKGSLQLDPLIDAFGNRLPNCFIERGAHDLSEAVFLLSAGLGPAGALLIFPEGGNFTEERRRRAIDMLLRRGHRKEAAVARRMDNLVAPKPGGTLAAIAGAPGADIVFVAHSGLPALVSLRETWKEIPLERPVRMRLWHVPGEQIPATRESQIDWLFEWWSRLDDWVDEAKPPAMALGAK